METPAGGAANNCESQRTLSSASASEERRKRRRLNITDELAHSRVESILREQLDLELYMKQKEVNTISTRLRHSEALLEVLESAIQSQQHSVPNSDDISDGFLSYFHSLGYSSHGLHEQLDWQQLAGTGRAGSGFRERPRRAAAAPARYAEDYYNGNSAQSANDDGDDESDTSIHSDKNSSRRASTRTQGLGTLATRLDAEQMTSVTDALDYISKHRQAVVGANAESSAGESDSDSWNDVATSKHRAQLKGVPVLLQPARESRFHIIRRVMLGNTSQFFDLQGRPPGKERSTHKWTLYIRSAAAEEYLGSYIRKARVFLHPSYRPDDIVDLIPPKFELT
ncbi:YEATS domain-containing protein 2, partial [Coemansia sp. RSA 522]